ncbi:hypothetical protein NH26_10350 [Flammeovirga pacifica]|uniref:DNA-binding protein n=1 Tax=Flammeovirga pacifica TaxID=915059 RepID=A0A1S1Z0D5_FLAPC|nr:hypothetical protein NH26_10350 [Flammeovirga pacifica]
MSTFISKKEFCELCNIKSKHITTYIQRNKIEMDASGLFDTENTKNYAFIKRKSHKQPYKKNDSEKNLIEDESLKLRVQALELKTEKLLSLLLKQSKK